MIFKWGISQKEKTRQFIDESFSDPVEGDSWAFDDGVFYYNNGNWNK
jgi:hypothetical protein